jgi:hypothetical protein
VWINPEESGRSTNVLFCTNRQSGAEQGSVLVVHQGQKNPFLQVGLEYFQVLFLRMIISSAFNGV